jgi:hypothetical protein
MRKITSYEIRSEYRAIRKQNIRHNDLKDKLVRLLNFAGVDSKQYENGSVLVFPQMLGDTLLRAVTGDKDLRDVHHKYLVANLIRIQCGLSAREDVDRLSAKDRNWAKANINRKLKLARNNLVKAKKRLAELEKRIADLKAERDQLIGKVDLHSELIG